MSASHFPVARSAALAAALMALALSGGCAWDYLNHEDKVAYSAGDAVRANLEAQTDNPERRTKRKIHGLGKDGPVIPDES